MNIVQFRVVYTIHEKEVYNDIYIYIYIYIHVLVYTKSMENIRYCIDYGKDCEITRKAVRINAHSNMRMSSVRKDMMGKN